MKAFFNKANRFSIKKLTIGTASVVIGSVLFLGFSGEVQASEQSDEVTSEHSDQGTDDLNEDADSTDAVNDTSRENGETQPNEAENEAIPQSEANTDTPQAEDTEAHEETEEEVDQASEEEDANNVTTGQEDTQDDSETDVPQDNQNEADENDETAASASNESKQDDTEEAPAPTNNDERKDASSNKDNPQLNETTATDVHEQQIDPQRQKEIEELEHEESEVTVDDGDADDEEAQRQKEIEELEHEESEVTVDDDDEDNEEAQRQKEIEELEHEESEVTVDDEEDDEEAQRQKEIEELEHEESEVTVDDDDDADDEEAQRQKEIEELEHEESEVTVDDEDEDDEEAQRQKEIEELEHEESEVTVDDDDTETDENNAFETDMKNDILSANHTNLKAHQDELNTYLAENHISEKTIQYINENWDNMNDKAIYQAILKDFNDKTNKYKTFATTPTTSRSRATDVTSREAAPEKTMDYTVEEGDFLGGIANKFETSTEHLQELNDIPNPDVIHTGQVLKVPDHSNAEPPAPPEPTDPPAPEAPQVKDYTVESGDTLSGIAGKFDTSTDHLQELNHLPNPDQLDVGQVLKVPDTGAAEPAPQPPQPEPGNDAQLVTMDQLQRFGWNAEDLNDHFLNDLNNALHRYQINTPPRIQHFMAQVGEESSLGQFRIELIDGTDYEGVEEIGNTQPGDGPKYKGGGYIQLTGRSNYTAFSQSMGDPEILNQGTNYVAENYPWSSAAWFWDSRNINSTVDNGGSVADVTQIVNGGQNGYDERLRLYEKAKTIFV
ncbi:LysM peptidoglycan-binding domain-containing protein [Staphylococcus auricularis]|uniref:LysM domain-containing protein n=1 Tax=Staphylococcus auricularis TaxID=29379 RepID=A0ABX5IES3_9STAP|nr:LysM peptidoglycan-binding domain-containing protein [Staphylococcus auricularis]PTH18475.1 hypothetical protein BU607_04870 [Staphylococcus auricularis]